MAAPLRGTQSLVGQMSWVFARPSLTAIEVGWRWTFGLSLLAVCWMQTQRILLALSPEAAGLTSIDPQNPWVAAEQIAHAMALYRPYVVAALRWIAPLAALAWVVASGVGRSLLLSRMEPGLTLRGRRMLAMIALQAAWMAALCTIGWAWFRSMEWVAASYINVAGEPDLVGFSVWTIFLSLGCFTLWALASWPLTIAPLLMLLEGRSALSSLGRSFRLGKEFNGKLVEINLVMGIVKLALIVLTMVLSAAPLPFSDQLGPDAMHGISAAATIFYLVASDSFQVVRLKSFLEFWERFCGEANKTG
jgi:hypothetical protein